MDKAPTMPSDSTTLEVTAKITTVVIIVRATKVTPKLEEYITPEKVFFVNEEDKHADAEGQSQREEHVQNGDACDVFKKTGFENVLKGHKEDPCFLL
ncbi:hypothetical protein I4300191C4_11920 [Solibaculum mannosilyticum]